MKQVDLVIIGGGSAGLTGAAFGVQLGARVALVEKNRIGGDCTWTGCVPSKTLLKVASVAHNMRNADRFGLAPVEPQVELKSIMAHVRSVVEDIYREEAPDALRADGIDVYLGGARFLDANTILAGDQQIKANHFLVATGAHPFIPPIEGLDQVDTLTYENIWELEALPQHLMVIGAGPIGCEMAQAFRRLGSQVSLIEGLPRLLPRDDPQASETLAIVFKDEGINLHLDAQVERAWQDDGGIHLSAGGQELVGDALLVSVGRHPNVTGMDLEKAGVQYSPKGIMVDENLRTSQRHIYAAGDCLGGYQFTHYAGWQAAMAVRNALLPGSSKGVKDQVPWTTFTDPEVAHVGLTEDQAQQRYGEDFMVCEWPMEKVDRARTELDTDGFIKLVHKKDGRLLGATIVARRAGEMIHEWIVALEHEIKVGDLANDIHIYPTYAVANMQAAAGVRIEQLLSGASGKVIRSLARIMR